MRPTRLIWEPVIESRLASQRLRKELLPSTRINVPSPFFRSRLPHLSDEKASSSSPIVFRAPAESSKFPRHIFISDGCVRQSKDCDTDTGIRACVMTVHRSLA